MNFRVAKPLFFNWKYIYAALFHTYAIMIK